jgi:hypothetical protein
MKWLGRLLLFLLIAIVLVVAVAFLLPARMEITRSIALRQTPEAIFTVLSDVEKMPDWNRDLEKVEMLPPADGKEATRQRFKDGVTMTVVTTESLSPTHLVRAGQGDMYSGVWTYEITPTNDGSTVTLTEKSEIKNPMFRLMVRLFGARKYLDRHLVDLARHFGESATPR